jgi:PAS domain S-box-containing protein
MLIKNYVIENNCFYLEKSDKIRQAIKLFKEKSIDVIPIIDENKKFLGVIKLIDVLENQDNNENIHGLVKDWKYIVNENYSAESFLDLLSDVHIRYPIFVLNNQKKLIGMIRDKDIINIILNKLNIKKYYQKNKIKTFDLFKNQHIVNAFNNMEEGIIVVDKESKILFANKAYTKMLGVSFSKIINRYLSQIEPKAQIIKVINSGKMYKHIKITVESLGVTVLANIIPIRDDTGNIVGAISSFSNITEIINNANKLKKIEQKSQMYKNELKKNKKLPKTFNKIVGDSKSLTTVLQMAHKISKYDVSVLITGENGTGKELLAEAIHKTSKRKNKPFIKINCSSIPDSLIESELFGYEEGSFTGARVGGKKGKFEIADGGTLLLDEIADLPTIVQPKLLRFLQEGEIEKIGSEKKIKVDVRIIAATNRNINEMINKGDFREDLYYRINIFNLKMPPLRNRKIDILTLINYYCEYYNKKHNKNVNFSTNIIDVLLNYNWPGNIRELKNTIEHCILLTDKKNIEKNTLPDEIKKNTNVKINKIENEDRNFDLNLIHQTKLLEERLIKQAIMITKSKSEAIERLCISRRTFYKKVKEYNIDI